MGLSVKQALLRTSEAGMDGVVRKTGIFTEKAGNKVGLSVKQAILRRSQTGKVARAV